jgi:hypothetical protein
LPPAGRLVRFKEEGEQFFGKGEGIHAAGVHRVVFEHGELRAVEAAQGFAVSEAAADLVYVLSVAGDKFFHPQFRRWDEPIGLVLADASRRGKAAGFKNFQAGFGDKMGGQKGRVYFKVMVKVKKSPGPLYDAGPCFKHFQIHGLTSL